MNNDPTARSAGRLAAMAAIPVALIVFFVAFQVLKPPPTPPASIPPSPTPISTAPVAVGAAQLDEHQATVCRAVVSRLPAQVLGLAQRPVTAGHDQNAAYGDPPLILACGGSQPTFAGTDFVFGTTGVCWHPDAGGTTWTTVDREVPVTLTLPAGLAGDGSAQWAAAFSLVIGGNVLARPDKPSGCP